MMWPPSRCQLTVSLPWLLWSDVHMVTSARAFLIELYEEYLEEASFLYEQRFALFANSEISWNRIADFEERLEAQIDGLVVGEELALEVCQQHAISGDSGEAHAAARVFCRQNRIDLLLKTLEKVDAADSERLQAVTDALKHDLPESWQSQLSDLLQSSDPNLVLVATEVTGYRRLKGRNDLMRILEKPSSSNLLAKAIWALGRLADQTARGSIFFHLTGGVVPLQSAAAVALLRLGDERALNYCLQRASSESWAILPTALGGSREALEVLLDQAMIGPVSSECLIGLGLLGYAAAIPILIRYLDNDETATAAANSLNSITGAGLREEVFIPETVDEDELFEEERETLKDGGQVFTRADGKPFGTTVKRVSQKPEEWRQWWNKHRSSLDFEARYRNGTPYSPSCLVADLEQESTIHDMRRLTYEELVIRYGLDVPFEADMFVAQQMTALASATEWARQQGTRVVSGRSYFAGKPR